MLEAIILGLVQGLTEFLPISSSAHLRILGEFLPNAQDPGAAFTAITQIGTETAVVVFFWRDIVRIVSHWFRSLFGRVPRHDPDARMGSIVDRERPIGRDEVWLAIWPLALNARIERCKVLGPGVIARQHKQNNPSANEE